jgi:hypothetical protein
MSLNEFDESRRHTWGGERRGERRGGRKRNFLTG